MLDRTEPGVVIFDHHLERQPCALRSTSRHSRILHECDPLYPPGGTLCSCCDDRRRQRALAKNASAQELTDATRQVSAGSPGDAPNHVADPRRYQQTLRPRRLVDRRDAPQRHGQTRGDTHPQDRRRALGQRVESILGRLTAQPLERRESAARASRCPLRSSRDRSPARGSWGARRACWTPDISRCDVPRVKKETPHWKKRSTARHARRCRFGRFAGPTRSAPGVRRSQVEPGRPSGSSARARDLPPRTRRDAPLPELRMGVYPSGLRRRGEENVIYARELQPMGGRGWRVGAHDAAAPDARPRRGADSTDGPMNACRPSTRAVPAPRKPSAGGPMTRSTGVVWTRSAAN